MSVLGKGWEQKRTGRELCYLRLLAFSANFSAFFCSLSFSFLSFSCWRFSFSTWTFSSLSLRFSLFLSSPFTPNCLKSRDSSCNKAEPPTCCSRNLGMCCSSPKANSHWQTCVHKLLLSSTGLPHLLGTNRKSSSYLVQKQLCFSNKKVQYVCISFFSVWQTNKFFLLSYRVPAYYISSICKLIVYICDKMNKLYWRSFGMNNWDNFLCTISIWSEHLLQGYITNTNVIIV